jgi:regulation of enolase protein 1 (concanavalin A-like superfamily)
MTGDFDGDGRPDIAVAESSVPTAPGQLSIFLNSGLLQFTRNTVTVPKGATDVTARDLNGDGALDLVVSGSTHLGFTYANDGFVYVFTGGGDGTFTLSGTYPTGIGPMSIVIGDFTRDGRPDVATGNMSGRILDHCAFVRYAADSISILPGNGAGAFGAATTFALGSQVFGAEPFVLEVDSLNTSDLNRDGHPDLIASEGRLLLPAAPRTNRAPVVNAGADVRSEGSNTIDLRGGASDPDGHLLSFRVRDAAGRIDYPANYGCIDNVPAERHELTMTASDGRLQASDTVVFDFSFDDPGPPGWSSGDIGGVAAAGSSVWNPQNQQGEFTVQGSGADIWGRADEFHFTQTPVTGDFTIYTTVDSVENVNVWTKAGLMIREGLTPGARHASLFATPTTQKGLAFQRRLAVNGLSVHTAGPAWAPPVVIMLKRTGDLVSAYYRRSHDGSPWTVLGRDTIPGLAATVNVGLAVSSHLDGTLATARFGGLLLMGPGSGVRTSSDIGAVGVPGDGNFSQTTGEMHGSGADIWNTADSFYFFREWWTSDATATVRVQSLEQTDPWAKMGLMFRETGDPGSRHVMLVVSASRGVAMQYRAQTNGISANVALTTGAAPEWLRLRRSGNTFTGFASEDGVTWRTVGSITLPLDLDTYVGVALTSHDNSTLATGVFDNLSVVR